jgi:hypothetical protein
MTLNNLGTNSASTKDWLEAMKNQSSSGVESRNTGALASTITKEDFETALKQASRRVPSSESAPRKK